jgi:hypothetical protein
MPFVGMVQLAVHQIIDVIPVRHRLMSTARPVRVPLRVASGASRATVRMVLVNLDDVLVHVIFMRMMQMPVVKIVQMAMMLDRLMAAARPMLMGMIAVNCVVGTCVGMHGLKYRWKGTGQEDHLKKIGS